MGWVIKAVLPWMLLLLFFLMLITYIPQISLFLPEYLDKLQGYTDMANKRNRRAPASRPSSTPRTSATTCARCFGVPSTWPNAQGADHHAARDGTAERHRPGCGGCLPVAEESASRCSTTA
jgi:hypothetical protein